MLKKGNNVMPITSSDNPKKRKIKDKKELKDKVSDKESKIENKNILQNVELPKKLNASLRNYQKIGFEWLKVLNSYGFGGILADDMGLRENTSSTISNFRIYSKHQQKRFKNKYRIWCRNKNTKNNCSNQIRLCTCTFPNIIFFTKFNWQFSQNKPPKNNKQTI